MVVFIVFVWIAATIYQVFLGYGTAYRLTKEGSDNGTGLFLWLLFTSAAALVPGLGFYIWNKYKNIDVPEDQFASDSGGASKTAASGRGGGFFKFNTKKKNTSNVSKTIICQRCGREYDAFFKACSGCGFRDLDKRNQ